MFRLTREVRFAINASHDPSLRPTNSFGAFPSIDGMSRYYTLLVTLSGELDPKSHYLRNIKEVDTVVRELAIPVIAKRVQFQSHRANFDLPMELYGILEKKWPALLTEVVLVLSPQLSIGVCGTERNMIRLSEKFEFSASHRLFNPVLSDEENRKTYGKCSNPAGHGHNYELQVTIAGEPDDRGGVINIPKFEQMVAEAVVERFDHKNLNVEVAEFKDVIPSVENISRVIYQMLRPRFDALRVKLASVTVWETRKTWCEYSE